MTHPAPPVPPSGGAIRLRPVIGTAGAIAVLGLLALLALRAPQKTAVEPVPSAGSTTSFAAPASAPALAGQSPAAAPSAAPAAIECAEAVAARSRLEARFRADLEKEPLYEKYRRCAAAARDPKTECRLELSEALYASGARAFEPFVAEEAKALAEKLAGDPSRLKGHLHAAIRDAKDPVESMVALNLLHLASPAGFPLPKTAYDGLARRTDPEAQLLLGAAPLPDGVRDDVAALALDGNATPRVRVSAMRTLGTSPDDVPYIGSIADAFVAGDPATEVLGNAAIPMALARCGEPCTGTIMELVARSSAAARRLAYRTIPYTEGARREFLEQEMAGLSPDGPDRLRRELASAMDPIPGPL